MVDHVPAGPHYVPVNADHMRSGPAPHSGEFKPHKVSQLEREIAEYLGLRRSLHQTEIPHEIRSIAENRLKELENNMQHGSIDIYKTFIKDNEQLKREHPAKAADYDEEIEVFSREMANIKRARRVLAGEEP